MNLNNLTYKNKCVRTSSQSTGIVKVCPSSHPSVPTRKAMNHAACQPSCTSGVTYPVYLHVRDSTVVSSIVHYLSCTSVRTTYTAPPIVHYLPHTPVQHSCPALLSCNPVPHSCHALLSCTSVPHMSWLVVLLTPYQTLAMRQSIDLSDTGHASVHWLDAEPPMAAKTGVSALE